MKILMVCLGNICRSPMAQGVMENIIQEHQLPWKVDSAGTNGYHNGEHPDPRAIRELKKRNIDISGQISRKIKHSDLDEFDIIVAMDSSNYSYLKSMCSDSKQLSRIHLLMNFDEPGKNKSVPDPYYNDSFDEALKLIHCGCLGIIERYRNK